MGSYPAIFTNLWRCVGQGGVVGVKPFAPLGSDDGHGVFGAKDDVVAERENAASGWPRVLNRFAAEAWRRADAGDLTGDELYPCDQEPWRTG